MKCPLFSIIIVSLNGRDRIQMPLDSLRQCELFGGEIILVDNGSTDGLSKFVRKNYPEVRIVRSPKNLGFAGGNNLGIMNAKGEILVLLNDDTEPEPDWLVPFEKAFREDTELGIAGCKLIYPDKKTIQHLGGYMEPNGLSKHVSYGDEVDKGEDCRSFEVDYVTGAAFAIRRKMMKKVGILDPGFWPIYFEETDYCERAKKAGWKIKIFPESVVVHYESQTTDRYSPRFLRLYHRNRWRFLIKNRTGKELLKAIRAELRWIVTNRLWDQFLPLTHAYAWAVIQYKEARLQSQSERGRR